MRALFWFSSAAMVAVLLAGCSDGESGDAEEAGHGWRAASQAMSAGTAEFQQQIEIGAEGEIEASCPEGGSVTVQGQFDGEDRYELDVDFDGCTAQGVTMNGALSMSAVIEVSETRSEVRFDYAGMLDFSGAVELSCGIDVTGRVAATASSAEASFEGTVCGVRADSAIAASAG